jgi:autotransporter-associated beta strand protein
VGTNTYGGKITLGTAARINSESGLLTLSNTNAVTGAFGLTFGGTGDIVLAAALTTGAGTLTKDGSGTLTLATANTYTGTTTISAGTIAMSGSDTFADSSSLLLDGGSLAMGAFNDTVASVSLRRGSITGTGTLTTTTTSAYAFQEGSISVNLVSTPITVGLAKTGSGTVTLSGTTNYTGATAINAGRLVLDYSSGNTVLSSASAINLSGGILEVKGASTPTAVTLGALTTTAAAGLSTVVVDANTAVTAASYTRSSGSELLIDLSATGSSMAFTAAPATKNGVLLGIGGSNAAVVMKDSNGRYDFASVGTGNTVVRLNATTALPTTVGNVNTSYVLTGTGNTFTLGANVATSTVRIDTTTAGGTLDLAGKVLSFDLFGLLVDGSNDFTITSSVAGGSLSGSNAVFIYQFGTGKLTLDTQITGSNPQTFLMGTGLLDWTAAAGNSGANYVLGLTVRLSGTGLSLGAGATGNGTGVLNLGNNGILELNSGDFTRAIGSAANGIVFYSGGAGFSAYGADRVVNIGGASAALSWGSGNFLASASKLILGSPYANATVDFQNPLGLNGGNQTVEVQSQNVTGVGGKISGVISGTGSFSKTGQGILTLSAANTYTGPTFVKAGTLLVSGSINGSAAVSVDANAELKLTGAGAVSGTTLTLADSSKLSLEVGTLTTAPITLTGSTILNGTVNLALTLTADPVDGTLFTLIDGSTPLLGYSSGARFAANGSALAEGASFLVTTGSFSQYFTISYIGGADGNDVTLLAIPEPSTLWTLCASVGLTLGISRFRRRRSPHLATVS